MSNKLQYLKDDGLPMEEVGQWAEEKYRLVSYYMAMFTKSMKGKWDNLVYLDLYAGLGRSRLKDSSIIMPGSPMLALGVQNPFTKYIFCEEDHAKIEILKKRAKRDFPSANVAFIRGDTAKNIDKVIAEIPTSGSALTFCFIDPYKVRNFNFKVVQKLSNGKVDFLILLPTYMDANRNISHYADMADFSIEEFTGDDGWREKWESTQKRNIKFAVFLADAFGRKMESLGFIYEGTEHMHEIRSDKNVPLYHLAMFSRNRLAIKFWQAAQKYSTDQGHLF